MPSEYHQMAIENLQHFARGTQSTEKTGH